MTSNTHSGRRTGRRHSSVQQYRVLRRPTLAPLKDHTPCRTEDHTVDTGTSDGLHSTRRQLIGQPTGHVTEPEVSRPDSRVPRDRWRHRRRSRPRYSSAGRRQAAARRTWSPAPGSLNTPEYHTSRMYNNITDCIQHESNGVSWQKDNK